MGRGSSSAGKGAGGKTFSTRKEAMDFFTSPPPPGGSYGAWEKGLSSGEANAVDTYTGHEYETINNRLRNDKDLGYYSKTVEDLDKALNKFELKENIQVNRGVGMDAIKNMFGTTDVNEINKMVKGKGYKIQDKGYASSSTQSGFEKNAKLRITVKKGKGKGAFVAPMSKFPSESEFLIKRNAKMTVKGAKFEDGTLIIDCEY